MGVLPCLGLNSAQVSIFIFYRWNWKVTCFLHHLVRQIYRWQLILIILVLFRIYSIYSTIGSLITEISSSSVMLCAFLFLGPVVKSAQFSFHVWLPMVVPTPAAAVIHAAGNFLIARLLSLFIAIPCIMNIYLIDVIMVLLGVTLTLAQRD